MALGRKKFGALKSDLKHRIVEDRDLGLGLGLEFVHYRRGLGRKRILISGEAEEEVGSMFDSSTEQISSKRLCSEASVSDNGTSRLESLPQDILIRVLCGAEHEDLKQLFHVSKTIKAAALVAKDWHFTFTTPKKALVFRGIGFNSDEPIDLGDEIEAPRAPKVERYHRRINDKKASEISMSLFT